MAIHIKCRPNEPFLPSRELLAMKGQSVKKWPTFPSKICTAFSWESAFLEHSHQSLRWTCPTGDGCIRGLPLLRSGKSDDETSTRIHRSRVRPIPLEHVIVWAIVITNLLWYCFQAHIFRVINMGSLYVEQTLDYKKNKANLPVPSLNMSVLYVGGVPAHVTAPHLANRRVDFSGCLRGIELKATRNESTVDLSAPDHAGSDAASGSCFKDVQPGLGFNSSGWTQFGKRVVTSYSSLPVASTSSQGLVRSNLNRSHGPYFRKIWYSNFTRFRTWTCCEDEAIPFLGTAHLVGHRTLHKMIPKTAVSMARIHALQQLKIWPRTSVVHIPEQTTWVHWNNKRKITSTRVLSSTEWRSSGDRCWKAEVTTKS